MNTKYFYIRRISVSVNGSNCQVLIGNLILQSTLVIHTLNRMRALLGRSEMARQGLQYHNFALIIAWQWGRPFESRNTSHNFFSGTRSRVSTIRNNCSTAHYFSSRFIFDGCCVLWHDKNEKKWGRKVKLENKRRATIMTTETVRRNLNIIQRMGNLKMRVDASRCVSTNSIDRTKIPGYERV